MSTEQNTSTQRPPFDASYKRLFSHPEIVEAFVREYLDPQVVEQLDFSTLTPLDSAHVSEHFETRFDDMVWQIRFNDGRQCFLCLLFEFQSTVDKWMAVRITAYTALLWQQLIKAKQITDKLPLVFPFVVYNGGARWNAPLVLSELMEDAGPLAVYQPEQRYFVLDEKHIDKPLPDDLASLVVLCEQSRNPKELKAAAQSVLKLLTQSGMNALIKTFCDWVNILYLTNIESEDAPQLHKTPEEVLTMLDEYVPTWKEAAMMERERKAAFTSKLDALKCVMESFNVSCESAMDALHIPAAERPKYVEALAL